MYQMQCWEIFMPTFDVYYILLRLILLRSWENFSSNKGYFVGGMASNEGVGLSIACYEAIFR